MAQVPDPNSNGGGAKRDETTMKVTSKDRKKKDNKKEDDLSEEDLELKQNLELYVERAQDPKPEVQKAALESMRKEIRASTSSMTSVPKPLKFLRPHYGTLKEIHGKMAESALKKLLADIVSVLALTMSAEGKRESLSYRLIGSKEDIGLWGHEYVRNLAKEVAEEYSMCQGENREMSYDDDLSYGDDLLGLVDQIVPFYLKHNAEIEAVDLLLDVEGLDILHELVDSTSFRRTCNYLTSIAKYLPGPDDMLVLDIAYSIYIDFAKYPNALQIALFLDNMQYVKEIFASCHDLLIKKQLCCMISRHGITFELDSDVVADDSDREMLQDILNNTKLSEGYLTLARDIDVMEAKTPEDIYKAHLLDDRVSSGADSPLKKLAATFVNAFVNAGFGQEQETQPVDLKNRDQVKTCVAASMGMSLLWDVDRLSHLDKYLYINDDPVRAGALMGVGIVNCGIKSDNSHALAILKKYIDKEDSSVRIGAIMGLGIAYAGSQNDEIKRRLSRILKKDKAPFDVIAFAALTLGMVYVGSCNDEVAQSIILAVKGRSEAQLGNTLARFLPLGLGLLYLGKQEFTAELSETFSERIRKYSDMTLLSCSYAGTGNVLKVQELMAQCGEHMEKGNKHQGPAVLGLAMVAMSEELGVDMAIRSLEHMLQYGEQNIRRAVPLALGLLCISNPKRNVMDTLSRLSHDSDSEVAMAAIFSLGLIGAGTINARIAGMLRNLSSCYYKNEALLYSVRIAQGLVYMGKGLLTLCPFHSERFLLSPTALAGIVTLMHACLDMKSIILYRYPYVLYFLVLAMQPRMMMTVDEDLKPISVPVRVGKAVDVVAQAGRPKTITGFLTHSTPVILAAGERAELATEKYIPLTPILEGFVILEENPDYREE